MIAALIPLAAFPDFNQSISEINQAEISIFTGKSELVAGDTMDNNEIHSSIQIIDKIGYADPFALYRRHYSENKR